MRFVTEARFLVEELSNIDCDDLEDNQYNSVFYYIEKNTMVISIILEAESEYDAISYYKTIVKDGRMLNEIAYNITYGLEEEEIYFEQCSSIDAYEYEGERIDFAHEQGYSSTKEWLISQGFYSSDVEI